MFERTPVDVSDPDLYAGGIPQEVFASIRATPGVSWNEMADGTGFWTVTRHSDLVEVSRDAATYSSAVGHIQIYDIDADALDARASMIDLDPPIHTRLRRLVSSAFTPRHVQAYQVDIRRRVATCVDALVGAGGGNWVEFVAAPIPIGVICDLMGVPEQDHQLMIELSDHLVAGTSDEPLDPGAYGNTTELRLLPFNSPAAHGINEYARVLGEQRRAVPADDLITKLIEARIDGDEQLTDAEFTNFFRLMIFAGNETTRSSMAHLALHLVEFADQFDRLRDDPTLVDSIVEEVIRYSSPILYFRRTATVDTELAGTRIAAGDRVVMWYAAANFDESVFDDPLRFDAARPSPPSNVSFGGGGVHFCLGASLARLELRELIAEILERDLRLEIVSAPHFVRSNFVNGIERLDVRVG
jgi:cytochrome P450